MPKRTTTQLLAELKTLAKDAGANIYRRIQLATEVLRDHEWIAVTCNGNEDQAIKLLESEYFADLHGYVTLGRMRQLLKEFSREAEWQEYNYDLAAMDALYEERHKDDPSTPRQHTNWKAQVAEREEEIQQLNADRRRDREELKENRQTISRLEADVQKLSIENAELKGRIAELEKIAELTATRYQAAS